MVNPFTGQKTLYCVKRPGWGTLNTPSSGNIGTAITVWTGSGAGTSVISAFGGTNSTIYNGTTSLGTITGKATAITETIISTTPTLVISSTDNTGWYYDTGAGLTQISDAQFPGNNSLTLAGTFAHMDGYAFIMDTDGGLWNSDLNSVTSWTSTGMLSVNSYPDKGVGCVRWRDKIMAFGSESTQFFINGNNPTGSPLTRVESMTFRIGCVNADAIVQIDDVVYWAGSGPRGDMRIYAFNGQVRHVSTHEIDAALVLAGSVNISLTATAFYGRTFLIVNASSVTYVYCVEENAWHEWNSTTRLWYKCAGQARSNQAAYAISDESTSGKVFTINPSSLTYQDNGSAFTARVQTSLIGEPNVRTFWEEIEIMGDTQSSSSTLTISYSDDDYGSYTVLGTVDLSSTRPRITRCGAAYRRSWVLTHSANTPFRIEALAGRRSLGRT